MDRPSLLKSIILYGDRNGLENKFLRDDRPPPGQPRRIDRNPDLHNQLLCSKCAENLYGIFNFDGMTISILADQALTSRHCKLCNLLDSVRIWPVRRSWADKVAGRSTSDLVRPLQLFSEHADEVWHFFKPSMFAGTHLWGVNITPSQIQDGMKAVGAICRIGPNNQPDRRILQPRALKPDAIDFGILRKWVQFCKDHHLEDCKNPRQEPVSHMRLIDCDSQSTSIIAAEEVHVYAALSSVWGDCTCKDPGSRLPEKFCRVVQDAIKVTKSLGMRYLWVDRYCIPDGPGFERVRHEQIGKMDVIYAQADVTIICAAGEDSSYGIPGVGGRPRVEQPSFRLGKDTYISTLKNPRISIRESVWWTRGWTFQEGLLSCRRLVFTNEQVYFECCTMHCMEVWDHPLMKRKLEHEPEQTSDERLFNEGALGRKTDEIYNIIKEYSARNLSRQSDGLNALAGVLRAFSENCTSPPFYCYMGIPMIGGFSKNEFLRGLLWNGEDPLLRRVSEDGRPLFPSWSWLGHVGKIDFYDVKGNVDSDIDLRVGLPKGRSRSWKDFVERDGLNWNWKPLPGHIFLKVLTANVWVELDQTPVLPKHWVYLELQNGKFRRHPVRLDGKGREVKLALLPSTQAKALEKPLKCVIIRRPKGPGMCPPSEAIGLAILIWVVNGVRERLGTFEILPEGLEWDKKGFDYVWQSSVSFQEMRTKREWVCLY